ncbi:MAG: DUF501 domain-containing protein [Halioglobus sp.]|nr:DUF501 domain-containing protein [Halioglobus sp.]
MTLAPSIVNQVAVLLGRAPRGLEDIAVAGPAGEPVVIRVASLVEDKPFPTLFWLVDPVLCYRIDQLEAGGLIKQFQQRVDLESNLQRGMRHDHEAYIALRDSFMRPAIRQRLDSLGFGQALVERGVGGIADFTRVRCLHTWYGAHLVKPNTVGTMLDTWWRLEVE